jgi:uncharacterized protein (DUF58 family)
MSRRRPDQRARRARPTWRGWAFWVCGVALACTAAWFGRVDLLFIAVFALVLPLAAMIALTVDRPWLHVTRSFHPPAVPAGSRTHVTLGVRNLAGRTTPAVRWHDAVSDGLSAPGPARLAPLGEHSMASRDNSDSVTLRYLIGADRRGAYDVGPLVLRRSDPFGLAWCAYAVGAATPLLVTPPVAQLTATTLDDARNEGSERELVRDSIPSADELIAREYRTGDPLRRVHWRATARHDKLMVRQEEQRSNPEGWLLFDTERTAHVGRSRPHERNPVFETAVELVAAIGVHMLEAGYVVGVVETAGRQLTGVTGAAARGAAAAGAAFFDQAAGEQLLLASLAAVRQVRARRQDRIDLFAAALRRGNRAVPAFAVLADGLGEQAGAIAALRALCGPAVAFLCGPNAARGEQVLDDAGWTTVLVEAGEPVESAWSRAVARHGGA